jgi:hypothetical protein
METRHSICWWNWFRVQGLHGQVTESLGKNQFSCAHAQSMEFTLEDLVISLPCLVNTGSAEQQESLISCSKFIITLFSCIFWPSAKLQRYLTCFRHPNSRSATLRTRENLYYIILSAALQRIGSLYRVDMLDERDSSNQIPQINIKYFHLREDR